MRLKPEIEKELAYRMGYVEALSDQDLENVFINGYKAALEWVLEDDDE